MQSIEKNINKITVCVNYYTELYGVISILTNNQKAIKDAGIERANSKYRNDVLKYFKDYKDCKVCKLFEKLSKEYYFNYDAPVSLFWQLNDFELDKEKLCYQRRLIDDKLFDELLKEIKLFEKESNYEIFYKEYISYYEEIINNFIKEIERYNPLLFLTNILKLETSKNYYINLMCGVTSANYGTNTSNKIVCNIRPYSKSKYLDLPDFAYDPIYYITLILHEFAHSFINDLVDERKELINKININKYKNILKNFEYGERNIAVYIDETIIRAIECLYVKETFPNDYESYIEGYYNEGFIYIKKVIDSIKLYITNINNYNNFNDYLDNVIKDFIL